MGTHSLSAKYNPVTGALKARLTGTDYQLPDFGASDAEMLIGRRVALVTTHGPGVCLFKRYDFSLMSCLMP